MIKLAANCGTAEILHEILHALGFIHEQSRPDRDLYVKVLWENVLPNFEMQFQIVPESFIAPQLKDYEFDYQSIMLYSRDTFAKKPGLFTLESLKSEAIHPTPSGLSELDLKRLDRLFH